MPQAIAGLLTPELIHATLDELNAHQHSSLLADQAKEVAASLACKAAIKAGDYLGHAERRTLVSQILSRWSSLTCPHGRPTVIYLGKNELAAMFLR